jgi:hypothetical protein
MWWLALVALAGCTQVFGLDDTRAVDPDRDRDHDGVEDGDDNCPAIANNDQRDADHDDIGDECDGCAACAPCANAVNHDEDGDQLDDACDNCPGTSNPAQENIDGDDAGDVCDVDNAVPHRRVLFDGFATLSDDWLTGGAAWKIVDDSATPTRGVPSGPAILRHAQLQIAAGTEWVMEIGVTPETTGGGIYLPSRVGQSTVHCALLALFPGPQWQMVSGTGTTGGMFDIHPQMRLRVALRGADVRCELLDVHAQDATVNSQYPYDFQVLTSGDFTFSYVDVLAH